PSSFLNLFSSKNLQNSSRYKNEKFDILLEDAAVEQDTKKRKAIYKRLSSMIMDDYVLIPLFSHVTTHLVKPYVGGYCVTNPLDRVLTNHLYILDH
ncbi:MAG: hypothetical protein K2X39_05635, partial [Silvanigrellaceae bacterium]|nr:hypothetical protein [Silvanigrellaceae bacterium]